MLLLAEVGACSLLAKAWGQVGDRAVSAYSKVSLPSYPVGVVLVFLSNLSREGLVRKGLF